MKKGFTLIELLVVISIIGILASIVMVSMSGATSSAKDARIKSAASQVRTIAELIDARDSSYGNLCASSTALNTSDAEYGTQLTVINTDISDQGGSIDACYDGTGWCFNAELASGDYYCVDSDGRATTAATTSCDGSFDCY